MMARLAACLSLLLLVAATASGQQQTHFVIGGESLLTSQALIESWIRPTAEYLNATVGQQLNITFGYKVFPERDDVLRAADNGDIDFMMGSQYIGGCSQQFDWRIIATQKNAFLGIEQVQTAGAMITTADRVDINTVADIRDRRIATSLTPSNEGTLAPWAKARLNNVDLYTAPLPYAIMAGPTDPLQALLRGDTDIAMVQAGWLELMVATSGGALSMDMFKVVDEEHNLAEDGQPFPFKHSTDLLYNHGVYARENMNSEVLGAVANALYNLESTAPAVTSYGFFTKGWVLPRSQGSSLSFLESLGILRWNGERRQCGLDGLSIFACPAGSFSHPSGPECANVSCPTGSVFCICRTCKFSDEFVVRSLASTEEVSLQVKNVIANSISGYLTEPTADVCQRVETCTSVPQQLDYFFEILDFKHYLRSAPPVVTYTVGTDPNTPVQTAEYVPGVGQYFARINRKTVGTVPISVYADGKHIEQSPFFVSIVPRSCDDTKREADANGDCVCGSSYVSLGGECVATRDLALQIALPLVAVLIVCMWLYARHQRKLADRQWIIPFKLLEFNEEEEELGHGAFGEVIKAKMRGTEVAVKKVLPPDLSKDKSGKKGDKRRSRGPKANKSAFMSSHGGAKSGSIAEKLTARRSGGQRSTTQGALKAYETTMNHSEDTSYKSAKAMFMKEVRAMVKLRHPCIVTCMGAVVQPGLEPMMVMELMDCSLESLIHNETIELDADILLPMLRDTADGMAYLHEASPPFIHRDLKAANVLVDSNLRAKVSDLGLSSSLGGCAGSPAWMAPELLNGNPNTPATDVYAYGIMIAEAFSRQAPFEGTDIEEALVAVATATAEPPVRPSVPLNLPAAVRSLMTECWANDPAVRPTFVQVQHRLAAMDIQPIGLSLFARRRDQAMQARVLHDVFPPHIADMLKRGEKVKPERRENVTLYFSDIVGFTNISATLSPAKVSDMLDRLYHRFDAISDKYDIFKVETIGDAYFAAANLVKDQPNHGERMANFAMEAMSAAENTLIDLERPSAGCIKLRIGLHTGSVVTNVVGSKNARFCLFGDTVNTSSRMESTSVAGHIHCSPEAAAAIGAQCSALQGSLVSRGVIPVKGKGEMETFWLRRPGQTLDEVASEAAVRRESLAVEREERAQQVVEGLRAKGRQSQVSRGSRGSRGSMDLRSVIGSLLGRSTPASKRASTASYAGRKSAAGSTLAEKTPRAGRGSYAAATAMTEVSPSTVVDFGVAKAESTSSPLASGVNASNNERPVNVNATKPVLQLSAAVGATESETDDMVSIVVV